MRKVTACFYPQNIRRAARKFLSAKGASPEQWVNTSVRVLCLKSIWRFDRQWERLQRVFTLRISGAPPESSFPFKARRPNSGWTLLYVLYLKSIWRFDRQWERLQRVFTLRISGAPPESSFPFKARRPNSGRTLLYVLYLKSIWRFDRQWERLQRVFTLRTSGAPPENFLSVQGASPEQWANTSVRFILGNLSDAQ